MKSDGVPFAPLWLALWLLTLPALAWLVAVGLLLIGLGVGLALLPLVAGLLHALAAVHVQAELAGVALEVGVGQLGLPPVEAVMHLPEPALLCRGLRRLRGRQRMRMRGPQGEMPEREAQVPAEGLPRGQDHRVQRPAVGTLEVSVLHQGDARVCGADHMVALGHRRGEGAHV